MSEAGGGLRVLVAPDSFKGSLTSEEVAAALARGWRAGRPEDEPSLCPLADGGEGTLAALEAAGDWLSLPAAARGPLMEPLAGRFLRRGGEAVIELAVASGLSRVDPAERDPMAASTLGTGQVLAAAVALGCRDIVLGIGGSATTDGGTGLLVALGARFLDVDGQDLAPGGRALSRLDSVDLSGIAEVLGEVSITIATDVTNPLLGETGAAATYGPQKGASREQVRELDAGLARLANVLEQATGRRERDTPGAGAAGGTGFALLEIAGRFASFRMRPGVEVLMELVRFDERLASSDLVLSGEGRIDAQTAYGKTAMGVARRAAEAGRPCLCFGGGVTPAGEAALRDVGAVALPVVESPQAVEEAMAAGTAPLERAATRAARLLDLGMGAARGDGTGS
jgi:glycerate 2-kinase